MSQFIENSTQFAADCVRQHGQCQVVRESVLFLDDGNELAAVDQLQRNCGHVVITPDRAVNGKALLYYTSCERMTDVVNQIFQDCLESPVRLPQFNSEMTIGELYRRRVTISYADCRARIEGFCFEGAPQE
ncbi:MAG: hypothetical protein WC830_11885 [Burkholderiales bacterium]